MQHKVCITTYGPYYMVAFQTCFNLPGHFVVICHLLSCPKFREIRNHIHLYLAQGAILLKYQFAKPKSQLKLTYKRTFCFSSTLRGISSKRLLRWRWVKRRLLQLRNNLLSIHGQYLSIRKSERNTFDDCTRLQYNLLSNPVRILDF